MGRRRRDRNVRARRAVEGDYTEDDLMAAMFAEADRPASNRRKSRGQTRRQSDWWGDDDDF